MTLRQAVLDAPAEVCRPRARHVLPPDRWAALAQDPALRLLALWADTIQVHALLLDATDGAVHPVSTPVQDGSYPSLSVGWPGAAWFERMVQDLWGHAASDAADLRPWLDHGHWPHTMPLAPRPGPSAGSPEPPEFPPGTDDAVMQLPVGPVHDVIGEPAHLRLTVRDDRVLRAESRLGYAHKGTLLLLRGKSPRAAVRYAARLSADATVAHAIAFAHAAEAASDAPAPPRAVALRALMAELERIASHLDAYTRLADALDAAALGAEAGLHRELLRRAAATAFGHRLMMDCVVPGGVAADITPGGAEAIGRTLQRLAGSVPALRSLVEPVSAGLRGLVAVPATLADRFALGGVAGRAAGRRFDARLFYPPYPALKLTMSVAAAGDAAARNRLRLEEIAESLRLATAVLEDLPDGAVSAPLPPLSGEGVGCAESWRGDIWHWLRLDHGQIAAAFARDPGWALWPVADTVLAGSRIEEADLVRCSFDLPASGMDL